MTPKCLKELRTLCFSDEFSDAYTTVQAAKARVTKWEANGGLRIWDRTLATQSMSCHSVHASLTRLAWLHEWRDRSFLIQIARADAQVQRDRGQQPTETWWEKREGWQSRFDVRQSTPRGPRPLEEELRPMASPAPRWSQVGARDTCNGSHRG